MVAMLGSCGGVTLARIRNMQRAIPTASFLRTSDGGPAASARAGVAPARDVQHGHKAWFFSGPAAASCTRADDGDDSNVIRGRMASAVAIMNLRNTSALRVRSDPVACSCNTVIGDDSSAIRGGIAPRRAHCGTCVCTLRTNRAAIATTGAIPPLIALLSSPSADVHQAAAACALGNLGIDNDNEVAVAVAVAGAFVLLSSLSAGVQEAAVAGALQNLGANPQIEP